MKVSDIENIDLRNYIISKIKGNTCETTGFFGYGAIKKTKCEDIELTVEQINIYAKELNKELNKEQKEEHIDVQEQEGQEQVPTEGPYEGPGKQEGGMFGGDYDSDYSSDESIISSDDEAEDIIPYTTAVFDDDDDDDMMDHIRNMKSKKYLRGLHTNDLRDILRKNNLKITSGGNYLNKNEMIKSIKNYYK